MSGCISSVSTVKRCGQLHRRQINISSGKQGVKPISIDMWSKSKQPEKELTGRWFLRKNNVNIQHLCSRVVPFLGAAGHRLLNRLNRNSSITSETNRKFESHEHLFKCLCECARGITHSLGINGLSTDVHTSSFTFILRVFSWLIFLLDWSNMRGWRGRMWWAGNTADRGANHL